MGELAIDGFQIQLDGADGFGCAAADLGNAVLKPVRHVDPSAMLGAGDRVTDRLTSRFHQCWDVKRSLGLDVDLAIDRQE